MKWLMVLFFCGVLVGCSNTATHQRAASLQSSMPQSILVLPPTNRSVEVDAPWIFLSTISKPLAERGYYVFPVSVVARLMRENGMHTPAQMHQIPLDLLQKHTGAQAVLYVDIKDWGQTFQLLSSKTEVKAHMKLVLTATGQTLWSGVAEASKSSQTSSSLAESLISAVITQIDGSLFDHTYELSQQANKRALRALPYGPLFYDAKYNKDHKPAANDSRLNSL